MRYVWSVPFPKGALSKQGIRILCKNKPISPGGFSRCRPVHLQIKVQQDRDAARRKAGRLFYSLEQLPLFLFSLCFLHHFQDGERGAGSLEGHMHCTSGKCVRAACHTTPLNVHTLYTRGLVDCRRGKTIVCMASKNLNEPHVAFQT